MFTTDPDKPRESMMAMAAAGPVAAATLRNPGQKARLLIGINTAEQSDHLREIARRVGLTPYRIESYDNEEVEVYELIGILLALTKRVPETERP